MKKLLIATDLSPRSDRALYRALELASDLNYNLHVLHVIDGEYPDKIVRTITKEAKSRILEQINTFNSTLNIKVNIKVLMGKYHEVILSESEKINAKAIILGTQQKDTLKNFFIGSTAERVVRSSNVPVFVIKNAPTKKYKKVVVAIDFSVYSRKCLEFALDFFSNEEIYLVHCYHIPYKHLMESSQLTYKAKREQKKAFMNMVNREMTHFLKSFEQNTENIKIIIKEGPVITRLNNEMKRLKADILIMGTRGRLGISRAFLGSVAEDMLITSNNDLVILNAW